MIDVHYWPTPNGFKITIMFEECGLPYRIVPVNIGTGEQFKPEFLKISPNNRMPAIVDHDPRGGGEPVAVFESGAILQYLAEQAGKFLPKNLRGKYEVLQWLNWQMGGPLEGTRDVLLIVRAVDQAEVTARLAPDVWMLNGFLQRRRIAPWTLRSGELAAP